MGSSEGSNPGRARGRIARVAGVVALALAAQLTVFAIDASHAPPDDWRPDTGSYVRVARDLLGEGDAFAGLEHRRGERTPGYPVLLAVCFALGLASPEAIGGVIVIQLVLAAFAAGLVGLATEWLAGSRAGLAAGILAALEPSTLGHANVGLTEVPLGFVLSIAAAAWTALALRGHTRALVALTLALALAPLIKPISQYLPFVLLATGALLLPRVAGGRKALAAALLLALLPGTLWSLHNRSELGFFGLTRMAPFSLSLLARDIELRVGAPERPGREPVWEPQYGRNPPLSREAMDASRREYARGVLLAHPLEVARIGVVNFVRLLGVPDNVLATQLYEEPPPFEPGSVAGRLRWLVELGALGVYLALGGLLALTGFAAIGWFLLRAPRLPPAQRAVLAGIALLVLYHAALGSLVTGGAARYRTPLMPALTMLAVVGIADAARVLRRRAAAS